MSEKPILFSDALVRAILAGTKTQTRRLVKPQPRLPHVLGRFDERHPEWTWTTLTPTEVEACHAGMFETRTCPYGMPGDTLLVVELRSIPGVAAEYRAGSDGRIYSTLRSRRTVGREHPFPMRSDVGSGGYEFVQIVRPTRKSKSVHAMICAAFHGEPTAERREVRHLDGNKRNNAPGNLAWGTRAENEADKRRHQTLARGERHGAAKLTDADAELIRRSVGCGLVTTTRAAEHFGVLPSTIRSIVSGRSRRDVEDATDVALPRRVYRDVSLSIERISVERVQEISEEDARAEGFEPIVFSTDGRGTEVSATARERFEATWRAIYGDESWDRSDWCWVVEFKRVEAQSRVA